MKSYVLDVYFSNILCLSPFFRCLLLFIFVILVGHGDSCALCVKRLSSGPEIVALLKIFLCAVTACYLTSAVEMGRPSQVTLESE